MRIRKLDLKNYRTFESLELNFPDFYAAICGQNDAGKSNIIRALLILLGPEEPFYRRRRSRDIDVETDFPKWLPSSDRTIEISCTIEVDKDADAGLYSFLKEWLEIDQELQQITLVPKVIKSEKDSYEVTISVGEREFSGLKAQEVQKRLRSTLLVHNSTEHDSIYSFIGELDEFSVQYAKDLTEISKKASSSLKRVAKAHKEEITSLLGRLSRTYKVEITLPDISLNHLPYDLTLGDSKVDISLSEWGSGTKNRTMILLALLKARQVSQSATTSSKVTPVLVIEEPESFLHPSAQAEFGRVVQDISSEFGVQVITTTHSPYMLSKERPSSNILIERKIVRGHFRGSAQVDTDDQRWMEPFSLVLGLSSEEFKPWRDLLFNQSDSVLLVEGATDKEYFEMLRGGEHGDNGLVFDGVIFDYDGCGSLKNPTLLKFMQQRSKRAFITYDLDVEAEVRPGLERLSLKHRESFLGLGHDKPGLRSIEGLLPKAMVSSVNQENQELVQQAMYGTKDEQRTAKNQLKKLYLEKFKKDSSPGDEWFGDFYKLAKVLNRALGSTS